MTAIVGKERAQQGEEDRVQRDDAWRATIEEELGAEFTSREEWVKHRSQLRHEDTDRRAREQGR